MRNPLMDLANNMITEAEKNMPKVNDNEALDELYNMKMAEKNLMLQRIDNIKFFIKSLSVNDDTNAVIDTLDKISHYLRREI